MSTAGAAPPRSDEWLHPLFTEMVGSRVSYYYALAATGVLVSLFALAGRPPLVAFFGLTSRVPILLMLAAIGASTLTRVYADLVGLERRAFLVILCLVVFLFQASLSAAVVLSEPPGCFVLAVLPAVVVSHEAIVLRMTPRRPFVAALLALAAIAPIALRPDSLQAAVAALSGALSLGCGFFLGSLADRLWREQREVARHRVAILAGFLDDAGRDAAQLERAVGSFSARSFTGRIAYERARETAERIARESESGDPTTLRALAGELEAPLLELRALLVEARGS